MELRQGVGDKEFVDKRRPGVSGGQDLRRLGFQEARSCRRPGGRPRISQEASSWWPGAVQECRRPVSGPEWTRRAGGSQSSARSSTLKSLSTRSKGGQEFQEARREDENRPGGIQLVARST